MKGREDVGKGSGGERSFVGSTLSEMMFIAGQEFFKEFVTVSHFRCSFGSGDNHSI